MTDSSADDTCLPVSCLHFQRDEVVQKYKVDQQVVPQPTTKVIMCIEMLINMKDKHKKIGGGDLR